MLRSCQPLPVASGARWNWAPLMMLQQHGRQHKQVPELSSWLTICCCCLYHQQHQDQCYCCTTMTAYMQPCVIQTQGLTLHLVEVCLVKEFEAGLCTLDSASNSYLHFIMLTDNIHIPRVQQCFTDVATLRMPGCCTMGSASNRNKDSHTCPIQAFQLTQSRPGRSGCLQMMVKAALK